MYYLFAEFYVILLKMISQPMEKQLLSLYKSLAGHDADEITRIAGAGSNRQYFRLGANPTVVGTIGTSRHENEAFIYICRNFHDKGLAVPEILAVSADNMAYLQSDLGKTSLFDLITKRADKTTWAPELVNLLERTISELPKLQWLGGKGLDYSKCHPVPEMNHQAVMWDLNYFKYCFLKTTGLEFREDKLEDDFRKLSKILLENTSDTFMFRDFQSRNVMIKEGNPYFIDFQGGRRGPWQYDLVSFLWQAKASFPKSLREHLIETYISAASEFTETDSAETWHALPYFILFRTLQVLGAYGFRGYVERKTHFLQSIPAAINNLRELLSNEFSEIPYLSKLLTEMINLKQFQPVTPSDRLTIKVASFGYNRHGIPTDTSGNGGGFVFDCRGLHNPGRYDEYKHLTGLDKEVIDFLENDGSILKFLDEAYAMVDNSVETYIDRGFTSLMVSFGCTGGQHRSVYSAEHMATHLHSKFPEAVIELTHYELGKREIIK